MTKLSSIAKIALLSAGLTILSGSFASATDESGKITIGVQPWLGYGMFYVADKQGFFKEEGLDVTIQPYNDDSEGSAALVSGQFDAQGTSLQTMLKNIQLKLPVKSIVLLDISTDADAIIAQKGISTPQDLKGKRVAFEEGSTSHYLLDEVLTKNGMSISDVTIVPMNASNAGGALIAKQVDVAVTYEPYISVAKAQDSEVAVVATAGENPGFISDALIVRDELVNSRPNDVKALVTALEKAVAFYNQDPAAARKIIADSIGVPAEDLETAFDGVQFVAPSEMTPEFIEKFKTTFEEVKESAIRLGVLKEGVSAEWEDMFDTQFVAQ